MKITPELIQYLESLARIELTPAEEARNCLLISTP